MGDIGIRSNTKTVPRSDFTSQEFLSTKTWSSSDFSCSLNGVCKNHQDVEEGLSRDDSSSGPLSIHAGKEENTSTPNNQDSLASLDSSIKYFKSTVQQLFDDFYSNINHFDEFEKTFSGILSQNSNELDIDALIKTMMEHRTEEATNKLKTVLPECESGNSDVFASLGTSREVSRNALNTKTEESRQGVAAKNGYGENISNCYVINEVAPYEQKMRQLLSDIEINKNVRVKTSQITFSDNLKKFTSTRKKLMNYLHGHKRIDKETPVGYDKKHPKLESLDEEHREQQQSKYDESSFLNKICHFLCKKFRKGSYLD